MDSAAEVLEEVVVVENGDAFFIEEISKSENYQWNNYFELENRKPDARAYTTGIPGRIFVERSSPFLSG